jgi:hypothetical protein
MYPRNNPTPLPLIIGTITQISDGVVQTTGVSVSVSKDSGAFVAGANTPTVEQGEWSYTPSQAETDCNSLRIVLYKTGCYSRSMQAVFTASGSFGYAGTDQSKIANPTANVALTNTSIKSVIDAVSANMTQIAGQAASASAPVAFPASVANETTVAKDATVAKESTVNTVLTAIQNLNNLSAKMNVYGTPLMEIPDSGTTTYAFTVVVRDDEDKLVALDGSPAIAAANAAGTSRSANLSAVSSPSTGRYTFTYSVASTHPAENLRITISGTVSGEARYVEWIGSVVDYDTITTLLAIKAKTDLITAFPANFGALGIDPAGSILFVNTVYELGTDALTANDASGTARLLRSTDNNTEVLVTGSHHIAAVLHDSEPGSIHEDAFDTGALSARVLAPDASTEIATAVSALQVLSRLNSMIEDNGSGQFRFDTIAVSLAGGGGAGSTYNIQVEDRSITLE